MMNMTPTDEAILKTDVLGRVRTPRERREHLLDEFERSVKGSVPAIDTKNMEVKKWVVRWVVMGVLAVGSLTSALAEGRLQINLNPVWRFQLGDPAGEPFAANYDDSKWDIVSLPHSLELFPASLAGFAEHGRNIGWYRRELQVPAGWQGKKLFLEFQGAMQTTAVWVNGQKAGDYAVSGYDSFDFDITPYVKAGKNVIAVRVDDRVNPDIPPDGKWLDYILFGGLYRDVFLHVTDPMHLTFPWEAHEAGVRLTLPEVSEN
jgi:beta-galactosidase